MPAAALLAFLGSGCDAGPSQASVPAAAPESAAVGCSLEAALGTFADRAAVRNCGQPVSDGVCDEGCKQAVRACALESARARKPFTVLWANPMVGGVGTRRAIVGRASDGDPSAFEVRWIDYVWISTFDTETATMSKHRVRVEARACRELDDLRESCDPTAALGVLAPVCGQSPQAIADDAWMRCEGERSIVCAD
jgi:hypothetical protein